MGLIWSNCAIKVKVIIAQVSVTTDANNRNNWTSHKLTLQPHRLPKQLRNSHHGPHWYPSNMAAYHTLPYPYLLETVFERIDTSSCYYSTNDGMSRWCSLSWSIWTKCRAATDSCMAVSTIGFLVRFDRLRQYSIIPDEFFKTPIFMWTKKNPWIPSSNSSYVVYT